MSDQSSRRNFLRLLGLTAGAAVAGKSALAAFTHRDEIKKLNPQQQEFMLRYGKWMDEFIEIIRIQKAEPDNLEHQKKMMTLADQSEQMQPQLNEYLKDPTFAFIYNEAIKRMTEEI